jgi:quercetin dioxygenase-like cupin family protein
MTVRVLADHAATDGRMSVCALAAPPGASTPLHRHTLEDEIVVVHEGTLEVRAHGGPPRVLRPGEAVLLERGVPHRLAVDAEREARFLLVWTPAGFEAALAAAGSADPAAPADPDDVAALFAGAGRLAGPEPQRAGPRGSTLPGRHAVVPDPRT